MRSRRPSKATVAALLALLTLSCGGSGGGESVLKPSVVPAEVPLVSLTMIPSVGEHTFQWGPDSPSLTVAPALSWSVDFTASEDVSELWVRVRLLAEDGTACLLSSSRVGRVTRGNRYVASGDRYEMPIIGPDFQSICGDVFATQDVDVNFTLGAAFPESGEATVVQGFRFTHFYFFSRTGYSPEANPS